MNSDYYWEVYTTVEQILSSRGITDKEKIHAEVEKIINRNEGRGTAIPTSSKSN